MAAQKPSIPKGTRDFGPVEMTRRNYIFDTCREVFRLFGYAPIETPAMENLSTLLGKYGEEGDKLLFKVLNSGEYLDALEAKTRGLNDKELRQLIELSDSTILAAIRFVRDEIHSFDTAKTMEEEYHRKFSEIEERNLGRFIFSYSSGKKRGEKQLSALGKYVETITPNKLRGYVKQAIRQSKLSNLKHTSALTQRISEKGLRYDLTVPFARYVVQHQNEIAFPFKRYQMQPVWRADRPQKGRYREFYQCDVDVIGSRSLLNEVELVQIVEAVFARLGVAVTLKLNNRKILAGIAETIGHADRLVDITVAIDKLEKIGMEAVRAELAEKGIDAAAVARLDPILALSGSNSEKLDRLADALKGSETGLAGIDEMRFVFDTAAALEIPLDVELDLSLARGLNYYTGTIFEVKARDWPIGSICGGGRYDNLTGIFGMPGVSGVGISFGADRIYDVMEGLGLFPDGVAGGTRVMFVNFGGEEELASLRLLAGVRAAGIPAEIYPDAAKMKKQMEWANRRAIPFVAIVGGEEMASRTATLKNMATGEQTGVPFDRLAETIK
ncbi:MAG: histidine--tRNA ligase [Alistipes sp.]|nr:histidine--tRNA ligase [Alistipes sp.]